MQNRNSSEKLQKTKKHEKATTKKQTGKSMKEQEKGEEITGKKQTCQETLKNTEQLSEHRAAIAHVLLMSV